MKRILAICLFAASTALVGCGDPKATSVIENADESAIAEYERLTAEQIAAMDADPGNALDEPE